MPEENSDGMEAFSSDIIDLDGIDLSVVSSLPSGILRAAVERVCRELAESGEAAAYFQSSLRSGPLDHELGASAPPAPSPDRK